MQPHLQREVLGVEGADLGEQLGDPIERQPLPDLESRIDWQLDQAASTGNKDRQQVGSKCSIPGGVAWSVRSRKEDTQQVAQFVRSRKEDTRRPDLIDPGENAHNGRVGRWKEQAGALTCRGTGGGPAAARERRQRRPWRKAATSVGS